MKELIFASNNHGKIKEVRELFSDLSVKVVSLKDIENLPEIIEDGETFEENAFIKADVIYKEFKKPVIADDSGLSIQQLGGDPGVYSARYASENCSYEDNIYYDGNERIISIGELNGKIVKNRKGSMGFGYDPIFVPDGLNKTLAEMTLAEKNDISHRGIGFIKLKIKMLERNIL